MVRPVRVDNPHGAYPQARGGAEAADDARAQRSVGSHARAQGEAELNSVRAQRSDGSHARVRGEGEQGGQARRPRE